MQTNRTTRVLIVDDEPLALRRLRELLRRESDMTVVRECADGEAAINAIEEESPDVVFLDIQMPEITGFDVVHALEPERMPVIVFVTAYDEFALRAFEANAIDYLLKPYNNERFAVTLDRIRRRVNARRAAITRVAESHAALHPHRLVVRSGNKHVILDAERVQWFEAADNYVRLHIGSTAYLMRGRISALERRLDPAMFVRVHRSSILNVNHIASIETWNQTEFMITLRNGARVPTSRSYRNRVAALTRK